MEAAVSKRLRHPAWLIVLLGGLLGSGINFVVALMLWAGGVNGYLSLLLGTLANQIFHYAYYDLVFAQHERQLGPGLVARLIWALLLIGLALTLLHLFWTWISLSFPVALILVLATLALMNLVTVRISDFSSASLASIEYTEMDESFYDDQTDTRKVNLIRAWFHRSRFDKLKRFVDAHYRPGMLVADLGCGNCLWNTDHYPVTGVDINEKMMQYAQKQGRLHDYQITEDLGQTKLPSGKYDLVVISEVLEHLVDLPPVLAEIRRILKEDGKLLITVPYDAFMGPFFVMFNVNCLYQGYIKGSAYHRFRCGHVNHFTKRRLKAALERNGWKLDTVKVVNGLSLYASATKA